MRATGIILAGGSSPRMGELTNRRAVAAMPIASSYRAIDFALSSMSNSKIPKVAVLTQYNSRSLLEHLNSSKWWDFGRKQGGLYVYTPMLTNDNGYWYRGTADAIYQNLEFLKRSHEPYVVLASGDGIYKLDYNKILSFHEEHEADITVVVKEMPERIDVSRFGTVFMDEDCRIRDFEEKPESPRTHIVSTGIYILRKKLLIEIVENCIANGEYDFVQNILIPMRDMKRIYGYKMQGYWSNISSIDAYFETNMRFLRPDVRHYYLEEYPDVMTKVHDLPPVKYNPGSHVKNSLIGDGSIINGTIENSVLFHSVFVSKGCVIKNSIILRDVYLGDNTYIENCIVESHNKIPADQKYIGTDEIKII